MTEEKDLTLRQGLEKFYSEYERHLSHTKNDIPHEVKTFFQAHDVAHVLFGCDISLFGEGAVKIWTIFGTTLGFRNHIKQYRKANAYELSRNFSIVHSVGDFFKLMLYFPLLIIRAKRMYKPWQWSGFEPYLDTPLTEIRKEFNICID